MIPDSRALLAESDIVLRDGSTLHLRPFAREDAALVRDLLEGLSADSLAPRFFAGTVDTERTAELLVQVRWTETTPSA
ncbi:MAG TPA: hypothetical protein VNF75_01855 [Candidatus Dormibacteraeota bacterium]|nr:hypothetical protein [Candidatus Dormibacteraeota bacterium]